MASRGSLLTLVLLLAASPISFSRSIIQMPTQNKTDQDFYCQAWRLTVETNNAGSWTGSPSMCADFVKDYVTGGLYRAESEAVAEASLAYAKQVKLSGINEKDAWVFDVDETLLSHADYFIGPDEVPSSKWVPLAEYPPSPALPASLRLYNQLQDLGFTIMLLTGRNESQRNSTEYNLRFVGYYNWKRLLLRGDSDEGTLASVYKSKKRQELIDEGYIIHGNSGDQWSDLIGYAVGRRSFKLPNPLYYVP